MWNINCPQTQATQLINWNLFQFWWDIQPSKNIHSPFHSWQPRKQRSRFLCTWFISASDPVSFLSDEQKRQFHICHNQLLHLCFVSTIYKYTVLILISRSCTERNFDVHALRSSRKYPCPPQGRLTEIPRGRGVPKDKFFEQKYDTKMDFPEGCRGVQFQMPSVGGEWIFSETTHYMCMCTVPLFCTEIYQARMSFSQCQDTELWLINSLIPRALVSFAFKTFFLVCIECLFGTRPHQLNLWTPYKPRHTNAMKPELLKSWTLEIDYSRAPCFGTDQKTCGLWERDWK